MSPSLKQLLLADLEQELAMTRRVIERVPDDRLDWKPHEKSTAIGGLAMHCANLLRWQVGIVEFDEYDIASVGHLDPPKSQEDILFMFDGLRHDLIEALEKTDDEGIQRVWTLRSGDRIIVRLPKFAALRTFGLSHMIHHRGQLTVYLRLLEVPVPATYGASADEGT